jgi:hypothetical protein
MYFYLDWTKQRIDEMDATVASLEAEASLMKVDSKAKADQFIADLKKRRDEFQVRAKAGLEAAEAPLQAPKRNWNPSGHRSRHGAKPTLRRRRSRSSSNRPPSALSVGLGASIQRQTPLLSVRNRLRRFKSRLSRPSGPAVRQRSRGRHKRPCG